MFRIVLVAAALLVSVGYAATYRGVVPVVKGDYQNHSMKKRRISC